MARCSRPKKKSCPSKRKKCKRLPSINPFFHFLKCVWRKFRGCKRAVVLKYAVQKWRKMSRSEKQPFIDAACRAQYLHRKEKRENGAKKKSCPKKKAACPKKKFSCPKKKASCPKKKPSCPKKKPSCPKKKPSCPKKKPSCPKKKPACPKKKPPCPNKPACPAKNPPCG